MCASSLQCILVLKVQVWCRYTLFIPLYPVGMLAEMVLMAKSLPYLESHKLNSIVLPNSLNFAFDYHLFIQVTQPLQQFIVAHGAGFG